jgi:hypothetical protein
MSFPSFTEEEIDRLFYELSQANPNALARSDGESRSMFELKWSGWLAALEEGLLVEDN